MPGKFQVSSSTSGDPSYIYTSVNELEKIIDNYRRTFGIAGVEEAVGFAPSLSIMDGISKKAGLLGKSAVLRMKLALEGALKHYQRQEFTVDINLLKTIPALLIRKPPVLNKMTAENLVYRIREAEKRNIPFVVGGFVLLLAPYLEELIEGGFNLEEKGFAVFSGGGYGGTKGKIMGKKIDKPEFIRKIGSVFGINAGLWSTHIKDIYGFTESSPAHEGFWDEDTGDFVFRAWPDSRVYIVDPDTERPLQSGKGLLKILSPYADGIPSSCNVSLLQRDLADIFEAGDNFMVRRFTRITRMAGSSVEGCAYKAEAVTHG
jgi:hypothetical protein